jgi:nucleotide-binding universal stress UspA family protein
MKILLAIDGSPCSDAAVKEVYSRPWPAGTVVSVLTVVHVPVPNWPDPIMFMYAAHEELIEAERKRAPQRVNRAVEAIMQHSADLTVEAQILEGTPKKVIVDEAQRWGADLIVIGSHGYGPVKRFLLGSVSHAVALHAPCSVEIVRSAELLASAN